MSEPTGEELLRELHELLAPTSPNGLNTPVVETVYSTPQVTPVVFTPAEPAPPAPAQSPLIFANTRIDREQPANSTGMLSADQDSTGMLF